MQKYSRNEVKEVNIPVNLVKVPTGISLPSNKMWCFLLLGPYMDIYGLMWTYMDNVKFPTTDAHKVILMMFVIMRRMQHIVMPATACPMPV